MIRAMTIADIPHGMRLKEQNAWNQLEVDWRRQLEPAGCFVAELEGGVIGTACTSVFGNVAWISMVLVDASHRGRGVGTRLMQQVLAYLDERRIPSIRLDATSLGRPVYEKLGFRAEFELIRYEGVLPTRSPSPSVAPVSLDDLPAVFEVDRRVTNTDRSRLLSQLFHETPDLFRCVKGASSVAAFVAARPGSRAWQIGPCLGEPAGCRELLRDAAHRRAGQPVFLDVPVANEPAQQFAREMGLHMQRTLLRMGRGITIKERLDLFWSSFGPEKG